MTTRRGPASVTFSVFGINFPKQIALPRHPRITQSFKTPMKPALLSAACVLALFSTASAATLFSTNLQGIAPGTVTTVDLNAVTTGGTWGFNTGGNRTQTIVQDGVAPTTGDRALLFDDVDASGNGGTINFGSISLTTAANFATNAVTLTTSTGLRRTGGSKTYTYQFEGTGGTVGATITWTGGTQETVSFNGGTPVNTGPLFLGAWDEESTRVMDITAVFSGGNVTLTWGGISSGSIPLLNGVTDLKNLRFVHGGSDGGPRGMFIDEILVTQVPEPSAALLVALAGCLAINRRRKFFPLDA